MIAQDINVSYEDALQKSTPYFAKKLQHSVELIRKAEKIALTELKLIVGNIDMT